MSRVRALAIVALVAAAFGGAYAISHSGSSSSSAAHPKSISLTPASIGAGVTRAAAALPGLGSVPQASPAPATSSPAPSTSTPSSGGSSGGSGGSSGGIIQG